MNSKKLTFTHQKQLSKLILIDGLPRAGKSLLSGILPCYQNVENIKFLTIIEHILPALRMKKIDPLYAKAQLMTYLNEFVYDSYIGRNLNLRKGEQSSIYLSKNPNLHFKRLKIQEGEKAIKIIKKNKPIFLFQTHDVVSNYKYFLKLGLNCKIIEMLRNPIDVTYSWYKKGWGRRYTKDQQSFTIILKNNNNIFPWYNFKNYSLWSKSNEMEKCLISVLDLTKLSVQSLKKYKKLNNILIIKFEDFISNPNKQIKRMSHFTKKKYSQIIFKKLKEARCPRQINSKKYNFKKKFIRDRVNKKFFLKLEKLEKEYQSSFYNLK